MSISSPVMAVISDEKETTFANQVANALGHPYADIVVGGPNDACYVLSNRDKGPTYIIIEIGDRGADIIPELERLSEFCDEGTRVVVIGKVNEIGFYRQLLQLGILEYFTYPADLAAVRAALVANRGADNDNSKVISFISAASGDGSSTAAMNTAYCLATDYQKKTVLVDMDYQFGMIAKNLDLNPQFGIRELLDHPDRGIDATLIRRMTSEYKENLHIIAAPNELKYTPQITPETVRDLIHTLKGEYEVVVIDLPHIWSSWTAAAISNSTNIVMVAQLWLRSITHASRLLMPWRAMGISDDNITVVINRSGAKFKEGISKTDFERVCSHPVDFSLANDIRTIVMAENQGQTVIEVSNSTLTTQFNQLAAMLLGVNTENSKKTGIEKGFSFFKRG